MAKSKSLSIVGLLFLVATIFAFSERETKILNEKSWVQTTEEDFLQGALEDVIVTNVSGGEVRLRPCMKKIVEDHLDNSFPRFAAFDSAGNYIQCWYSRHNIYAQRFNAEGDTLGAAFQVNDVNGSASYGFYILSVSVNNEGYFLISWNDERYLYPRDEDIYAQLFDPDGVAVGNNFIVNVETFQDMGEIRRSVTTAGKTGDFWVLWSGPSSETGSNILGQRYSRLGEPIGGNFILNEAKLTKFEKYPVVSLSPDGNFIVTWIGNNQYSIGDYDIYARIFDESFEPKSEIFKVNDDLRNNYQLYPDVAVDSTGDFAIVWTDYRGGSPPVVYCQYFTSEAMPFGDNFIVIDNKFDGEPKPEILADGNRKFWVSWSYSPSKGNDVYANKWEFDPITEGAFISPNFDAGPYQTEFKKISWIADVKEDSTAIEFRIKSANSIEGINLSPWYGPQDTSGYYVLSSGENINPIHNGDRYIQYQAFLSPGFQGLSPTLYEVKITYNSINPLAPATPEGLTATPGHSKVYLEWQANREEDLFEYRLYLGEQSGLYDSTWTKHIVAEDTTFTDTSVVTGHTYYYALSAVDADMNESNLSDEVSAAPFGWVWYVDGSNPTHGNGSYENPFNKIQDGLDVTIFGDTVRVSEGTYYENIILKPGVCLIGTGADKSEVIGTQQAPVVSCDSSGAVIGFTLTQAANKPVILGNFSIILDNVVVNKGSGFDTQGIFIMNITAPTLVRGNIIMGGTTGLGAQGNHDYETASIEVSNNLIFGVDWGMNITYITNTVDVINNTVFLDESAAFVAMELDYAMYVNLVNNIIVNRGRYDGEGVKLFSILGSYSIIYNNAWTVGNSYEYQMNLIQPGEGCISADPLFKNVSKGDFRLNPDSPSINAGHPNLSYNDMDGSRNDMGAYGGPHPLRLGVEHPRVAVAIPPVSAFPGDTLIVPVNLDNAAGLFEATMDLTYDPSLLSPIAAQSGELTTGFIAELSQIAVDVVQIHIKGNEEVSGGEGDIVNVRFVVKSDASPRQATPLELIRVELWDGIGAPIKIRSITDGVFVVNQRIESENYIFVNKNYTGEEDGSWKKPFNTIIEGIANASYGDTVQVAAGIYNERLEMKDGVFLHGSGPIATAIEIENTDLSQYYNSLIFFDGVSKGGISGFRICLKDLVEAAAIRCVSSSPLITGNKIEVSGPIDGIACNGSPGPTIKNNVIITEEFMEKRAIICDGSDASIIGNRIEVPMESEGIHCEQSGSIIRNNIIRIQEMGVGILSGASELLIANNYLIGGAEGTGIKALYACSDTLVNNVIQDGEIGIDLDSRGSQGSAVIKNNIILNHQEGIGTGIRCVGNWVLDVSYNDFWDNTTDCAGVSPAIGNLYENPLFVDSEAEDFHLQPGSRCIDAGDPDPQYNDLDGSQNDMGVYGGPYALLKGGPFRPPVGMALSDTSAAPGDTVEVAVRLERAVGVAEASMIISYPSDTLSVLDARTTDFSRRFTLTTEDLGSGQMRIALSSSDGIEAENYPIVRLVVELQRFLPQGAKGRIKVSEATLRDELAMPLTIGQISEGTIEVKTEVVAENPGSGVPSRFALFQNYPNPFNASTTIRYQLPVRSQVTLKIYNLLGQEVRALVDKRQSPGYYVVNWNGKDKHDNKVASGIYFYLLRAGNYVKVKKMALLQ